MGSEQPKPPTAKGKHTSTVIRSCTPKQANDRSFSQESGEREAEIVGSRKEVHGGD